MTEGEWLASADPQALLNAVEGRASFRKFRLFACACARAVWPCLDELDHQAVRAGEQAADGEIGQTELQAYLEQIWARIGERVLNEGSGRLPVCRLFRLGGHLNRGPHQLGQGSLAECRPCRTKRHGPLPGEAAGAGVKETRIGRKAGGRIRRGAAAPLLRLCPLHLRQPFPARHSRFRLAHAHSPRDCSDSLPGPAL